MADVPFDTKYVRKWHQADMSTALRDVRLRGVKRTSQALTFGRWRIRIRAEVLDELRKVLDDDRRRWPDPRKRDFGMPERRKRPRAY